MKETIIYRSGLSLSVRLIKTYFQSIRQLNNFNFKQPRFLSSLRKIQKASDSLVVSVWYKWKRHSREFANSLVQTHINIFGLEMTSHLDGPSYFYEINIHISIRFNHSNHIEVSMWLPGNIKVPHTDWGMLWNVFQSNMELISSFGSKINWWIE